MFRLPITSTVVYVRGDDSFDDLARAELHRHTEGLSLDRTDAIEDVLERLADDAVEAVLIEGTLAPESRVWEVVASTRERFPTVPVVCYVTESAEETVRKAFEAGVTAVVDADCVADSGLVLANRLHCAIDRTRQRQTVLDQGRALSTLERTMPGYVYRCENEPGWQMLYISDGVEAVTGYEPSALTAGTRSFTELIFTDDEQPVWDAVQRALAVDEAFEVIYRIETADGETRWLYDRGRQIERDPFEAINGFALDVTGWMDAGEVTADWSPRES